MFDFFYWIPTDWIPTIWTGLDGLVIYEEIHQNITNQIMHVAFLPFVFYGIYRGVPALLGFNSKDHPKTSASIITTILAIYGWFYTSIDPSMALLTIIHNLPMAYLAHRHLSQTKYQNWQHVGISLISLTSSLVLLEVFGHTFLEEVNSRMSFSYVLNAIIYSPLYCTYNFNDFLPYSALPSIIYLSYELISD